MGQDSLTRALEIEERVKSGDRVVFEVTKLAFNAVEWLLVIATLMVIFIKTQNTYVLVLTVLLALLMYSTTYAIMLRWVPLPIWASTTWLRYWAAAVLRVALAAIVMTGLFHVAAEVAQAVVATGLVP